MVDFPLKNSLFQFPAICSIARGSHHHSGKDAMNNIIRHSWGTTLSWVCASMVVGSVLTQLLVCWVSLCGTEPLSYAALAVGFASGAILADWAAQRFGLVGVQGFGLNKSLPAMTMALVTLSWMTPRLINATLLAGCETAGFGGSQSVMLTLMFPALVVAVVSATAGMFFLSINPRPQVMWLKSALAGGPSFFLMIVHSVLSYPLAVTITVLIVLSLVFRFVVSRFSSAPSCVTDAGPVETNPKLSSFSPALHFIAAGMLAAAIMETMSRLLEGSVPVLLLTSGLTLIGLSLCSSRSAVRWLTVGGMNVIALLTLAMLPMFFSLLADCNLWINTQVSSPMTVIALRSLQCAILAMAAAVPAVVHPLVSRRRIPVRLVSLSFAAGLIPGLALMSRGFSPANLLACGIAAHATAVLIVGPRPARNTISSGVGLRQFCVSAATLLISTLTFFGSLDSTRTSAFLFSERTMAAVERGVEKDLITQSDANRLLTTVPGSTGEVSVWRRAGNLIEFQRNGISLGRVSTDTSVSPQPPEEILPAVMALVSHPQPSRVLILGDDIGVSLRTCSHFPVQEIVAVRSDEQLTKLARRFTWSRQLTPADEDSRVRIVHGPQVLALRDRNLKIFDVVIASSESATSMSVAFQFTTEYYAAVRSRMAANSIFCQRFRQRNSGPEPIRKAMSTLNEVFAHVGIVQMVPGEILLLATDQETGLIDPGILTRLQRNHVQREIASTGWDWSQVAILPLIDANDPIGIFSHEQPPAALSISRGGFVMGMPLESARRANKAQEMQLAFAPHQMQIPAVLPISEDHKEIERRLSALTQQLEILAGMPDQPWTYRKSLRMEMQRSPRPPLESVKDGKIVRESHPLDQFRNDYFESLGRTLSAVFHAQPTAGAQIGAFERFTATFEPLLTHFAHYELVRLHELAKHPSPSDEFRHRLHIVFFTSPSDASVRPVVSAIEQLIAQPQLIADDGDRYDMLNGLVQRLIERWEARTAWEPRSAVRVQNDVDQSVRVTNLALKMMDSIAASANVDSEDFLRRRRFITAALISPLRDYRDQVLAHRLKTEVPAEPGTDDPHDMPLLLNADKNLSTN